jgi:large subunit ribosomal protein L11
MAKKIKTQLKIQIKAGAANPAPPVGPILGQQGINIMDFCNKFNEQTKALGDLVIPVVITVYEDRSFDFILKTPPAATLIKKALGLSKGSGVPNKDKVGKLTRAQLEDIATTKMPDLNTNNLESAIKMIKGTARNMGVEYED